MTKIFWLLMGMTLAAAPAYAQRVQDAPPSFAPYATAPSLQQHANALSQSIIAVVNDSIITSADLHARLSLALLSAGLPDAVETRQKFLPQVLRSLVDEQLQLQEGKKTGIVVTDEEIRVALDRLGQENRIPGGDILAFLRKNNIAPATLKTQVKAALTWNKIVMRDIRPRIDIGEDEINEAIRRMRANAGKQEYLVSEIFLAVDKPEEEAEVQVLADKLVEQIKGGAVFGAAARQFSQGLGASNGGDLGWIQTGQLTPEIDKVLPELQAGSVAGPIRSTSGYHIIGLRDKRVIALGDLKDSSVKLEQIFRPFTATTEKEVLLREAENIRQAVTDCASLRPTLAASFPLWRWQDLGDVKLETAPAWLANKIVSIPEGQGSEAMATDKGALMIFVCGRTMSENINRDSLRAAIGTEKMELLARRLQRDLRKGAFIEVRMNKGAP